MGSTAPRPSWSPWKNLTLTDVSKPEVPYTSQPANLHRTNARIDSEWKGSWWASVASHCFRSSYLLSLPRSFVIHGKVSLWPRGFGGTCRSCKDVAWRIFVDHRPPSLPQELAVHRRFCSCSQERHSFYATWKCQIGARLGKKKPTSYPRSLKRERTFSRRNGLHSFHCMHYALLVSPTFLRAEFWWIAPIRQDKWLYRTRSVLSYQNGSPCTEIKNDHHDRVTWFINRTCPLSCNVLISTKVFKLLSITSPPAPPTPIPPSPPSTDVKRVSEVSDVSACKSVKKKKKKEEKNMAWSLHYSN